MSNPGPSTTVTPHYLIGGDSTDGTAIAINGGPVGFYGVTPVTQAAAITVPTDLATSIVAITAIITALKNVGLTK